MPSFDPTPRRRSIALLLACAATIAFADRADAQVIVQPDPQTEGPKPEDQPPPPPPVPVAVVAPAPPPQPMPMPMEEPFSLTRVRYGFTIFGGPASVSGADYSSGGLGGASFRLGAQINRVWGVYYHGQLSLGGYAFATSTDAAGVIFASWFNAFMASATVADHFEFALGPSIDSISSLTLNVDYETGDATLYELEGTAVGLHARLALIAGALDPMRGRRAGFSFSIDFHPTFIDGQILLTTGFGFGAEWY